jgi:hypothetical protein
MSPAGTPLTVTPPTRGEHASLDPRLLVGTAALLAWFVALTMTDFAHDALGIASADPSMHPAAYITYELACITGAAVHNADGITLLYDIAFAIGLIAVFVGVVPLHQHLQQSRRA